MTERYRETNQDSFELVTSAGRKIDGMYGPDAQRPTVLALFAIVKDPEGAPFAIMREYDITKRLELAELIELGEEIEALAQARGERGRRDPNGPHRPQLSNTGTLPFQAIFQEVDSSARSFLSQVLPQVC